MTDLDLNLTSIIKLVHAELAEKIFALFAYLDSQSCHTITINHPFMVYLRGE